MAFYRTKPLLQPIDLPGGELQLRAPEARDFAAWKEIRQASRNFLEPYEPRWPENDLTPLGFRRRLKRYQLELDKKTGETFFLVSCETDRPIGGISISNIRRGVALSCNIGYWMGEEYAGKGNMKKTVRAITRHVFADLKLCRVEAACLPDNKRSSILLEKTGFQREGLLRKYLEINGIRRDHILYARLVDD
ncbi:MAG: GNAT family N-acetyltransferase [Rhizobiaceae bacterium]|nr:GNAT family N-acetyltransferase [Rhizobiaceae bacterium]